MEIVSSTTGEREDAAVVHTDPSGEYAVCTLKGTQAKGVVDVYHVGTGKRATPPRHHKDTNRRADAIAFADFLGESAMVTTDGDLTVDRSEFHRRVDEWFAGRTT